MESVSDWTQRFLQVFYNSARPSRLHQRLSELPELCHHWSSGSSSQISHRWVSCEQQLLRNSETSGTVSSLVISGKFLAGNDLPSRFSIDRFLVSNSCSATLREFAEESLKLTNDHIVRFSDSLALGRASGLGNLTSHHTASFFSLLSVPGSSCYDPSPESSSEDHCRCRSSRHLLHQCLTTFDWECKSSLPVRYKLEKGLGVVEVSESWRGYRAWQMFGSEDELDRHLVEAHSLV